MTIKKIFTTITLVFTLIISCVLTSCSGDKLSIPDQYNYDDLSKYVNVCDYRNLKYGEGDFIVSDSDVLDRISSEMESSDSIEKTDDKTVTETSIANIDYTGSVDGVEFDGGAAEGYDLDIANSNFIDGFAEALIGHHVGETFDINVTFPEDYGSEDLAGKDAVFKIVLNYISERVKPELDDEWVKNNTSFASVNDYKEAIKNSLVEQKLFDIIIDGSKVVEYPEKEHEANIERVTSEGQDESVAEMATKSELVLYQIARLENIELTDEGYNEFVDKLLKDSGLDRESFEEKSGTSIAEYADNAGLFNSYMYSSVMDKIIEYSSVR